MKVYVLCPEFTLEDPTELEKAQKFYKEIKEQMDYYGVENHYVRKENYKMFIMDLDKDTLVVLFNGNDNAEEFCKAAKEKECKIFPIALSKEKRKPNKTILDKQSFDVYEQLRCRNLSKDYINIAAKVFVRKIISLCCPSIYQDEINIFLSHRRLDGEEIAAGICDEIRILAPKKNAFRDVVNIGVGEAAQDVVDLSLAQSDVLVFFHTNKSAESDWVLKELLYAIAYNIPVLWIKIGNVDINNLKYRPTENPHLNYSVEDFTTQDKRKTIADEILEYSFRLLMETGNDIYDELLSSSNLFKDSLSVLDKTNLIYTLSYPRKGYTYPQRTISQLVQFLGRNPRQSDIERINSELKKHNENEFDSAVIVSNKVSTRKVYDNVLIDNCEDFYYIYQRYINGFDKENNYDIVISGAFPDSDEIYKQALTHALICFVKEILKEGYNLCFGAHPTFQELIFETAKSITPDYRNKIRMYISEYYIHEYNVVALCDKCTPINVPSINGNQSLSLTKLRKEMICRNNVKALICMGGKIKDDKTKEGIREEISIAQEKGVPVFLIGSVGGCSAEISRDLYSGDDWTDYNSLSSEINKVITFGIDYKNSARLIVESVKNMEE